ncbi:hypothetical protein [Ileibacterium valens]|uniref:hypothetical protein n=1 Tax=Ileibacterium valens TaxID=1862668 RepID=UPI00272A0738|nr:hypothetical protein [Ileibacterium valens]
MSKIKPVKAPFQKAIPYQPETVPLATSGRIDLAIPENQTVYDFINEYSHGRWGYELVGDTLSNQVMKPVYADGTAVEGNPRTVNNVLAKKYGNFFAINMDS